MTANKGGSAKYLYIFSDAVSSITTNWATTALTSITLGFSLSIFFLFLFMFINLDTAVNKWGDKTHIVAYVKDSARGELPAAMKTDIQALPGVRSVKYVSSQDALAELKETLGAHKGILDGVDENPLPASFEIKVADAYRVEGKVSSVVERLKAFKWIDDVQYSQEWIEKVSSFIRFMELAAAAVGIFIAAATIFVISNTIRLTVYARRDEIEIMRLVGASDRYIKAPFFIEGFFQGILGGFLALAMLMGGRAILHAQMPNYLNFLMKYPLNLPLLTLTLVVCGITLGVSASVFSTMRFLKQ